jgi:predicted transcriptional regulator
MKPQSFTIRLDEDLGKRLARVSRQTGRSRSEIARDALRRQLRIGQFEALRQNVMPFAEARGYLTDDDVFREVS